jgi:hypothetical protein
MSGTSMETQLNQETLSALLSEQGKKNKAKKRKKNSSKCLARLWNGNILMSYQM